MVKQYFKCVLKTDIILNASLATEGNMKSLDYIPGSNFLGVVAKQLVYKNLDPELAYHFFHSGDVSFGDALLASDNAQSYVMPFCLYKDKLETDLLKENNAWVHHVLEAKGSRPKNDAGKIRQLKQHREGYLNANQQYLSKVAKRFALKSAQDRATRKSKDQAMFGFESIKRGQRFIFSLDFSDKITTSQKQLVINALVGNKKIGKSKTAQYGQVSIEKIEAPKVFHNQPCDIDLPTSTDHKIALLIYAESNLCFLNEYGQSTFQPIMEDFGIAANGKINWAASQVRTHSYSPWNAHRNTTNPQRDCILKGSVLVIELDENIDVNSLPTKVGNYQAEGLGRVLYNPIFLKSDNEDGHWTYQLKRTPVTSGSSDISISQPAPSTPLAIFLQTRKTGLSKELEVGKAVQKFIQEHKEDFSDISTSQWGGIRNIAIQSTDMDTLKVALFGIDEQVKKDNKGFLMNGIAAQKYWDQRNGWRRQKLLETLLQHRKLGTNYFAKLAAEFAKWKQLKKEA